MTFKLESIENSIIKTGDLAYIIVVCLKLPIGQIFTGETNKDEKIASRGTNHHFFYRER